MAVSNVFRSLIYGGVNSADYDIYISGDGVYNAPERQVEMITVPGRNGLVALDMGRFENVEIVYPCGTFATTQEEFSEKLSAFRNAIMSLRGYQRLEDTYHPEEFREAVFMSAIEVEPVSYNRAGEFELTFNCKPQRWLAVGALPIPVASGDVMQNPTPFPSGPLLEIEGYGNVNFNGFTVTVGDLYLGETPLFEAESTNMHTGDSSLTLALDDQLFNVGDTITVKPSSFRFDFIYTGGSNAISVTKVSGDSATVASSHRGGSYTVTVSFPRINLQVPADGTNSAYSYLGTVTMTPGSGTAITATIIAQVIAWGENGSQPPRISFVASMTVNTSDSRYLTHGSQISETGASVDSTISIIGHPTYIDCELGEAYKVEDGSMISLNKAIAFGSDLPTLSPGSNTVTFDNTITDLKITPRWWRV